MLARQPQARLWNRTNSNFPKTQGPVVWNRTNSNFPKTQGPVARKKSQKATQILRAGNFCPTPRGNPRKWGPGKGDYEHEVLIRSRPRRRFGDFAAVGKVTRRPQAAKSPAYNERSPNPVPSSVTASPCRLSLSPLSLRDIIPTPFGLRPFPPDRGNRPLDKGSRPPVGGRLWGCSNKEKFAPLWDVWIHILGIRAECAWWGRAARVCRPYKRKGDLPPHPPPSGAPSPQGEGLRAGEDTRPYGNCGQKRRAHNVRPYTAFTNGSIYKKRDRSRTCPLKHRGETQFRRKFFWFLFF